MLMVFVLELVPVLLSLLLVMVLVALAVAAAAGGGCGAAASDWVCFNKLNGFLEVKYARIFWIYLSKNNDSMYFKYC
jgi:ABC-type glycerol-3-phosphate transport system substrate-binding protein